MSDSTVFLPSARLKWLARSAKWLLWLLLAAWAVFALGVLVLHGFIVPRIDQFRPAIEARLGNALGASLSIERISARSSGLFPTIELHGVTLSDPAGRPALRLARVVATVSPASAWRAGFEQLYIGEPQLELRRGADGSFRLGALVLGGGDDGAAQDSRAADWLFSQPEIVIEGGSVNFIDEAAAAAPPLRLEQLSLVLRNKSRRHDALLAATPPPEWGERITLVAKLRQPLLSLHAGRWRDWSGQLYADLPRFDMQPLRAHLPAQGSGSADIGGRGALRLWLQVERAQITQATVQAALADLRFRFAKDLTPLALSALDGRFDWRRADDGGFDFSAQPQRLVLASGAVWPGQSLHWMQREADPQRPARGQLRADRLDLALLGQLAQCLPIDSAARSALMRHAPKGIVEPLEASWQLAPDAPPRYSARGRVRALEVSAQPSAKAHEPGIPGVRGASAEFDFDQAGGAMSLSIEDGSLSFPGIFEEPLIGVGRLSSSVQWQRRADHWQVRLPDLKFANADAAGEADIDWRTSDPVRSKSKSRFPGVLDLAGTLSRANAARVARYLPLDLPQDVRSYVAQALGAGSASQVQFRVRGDLRELPFADPRRGEFRIAASVRDLGFAYLPRAMQPAGEAPWPPLTQLSAELLFDRASLRISNVRARLGSAPGLALHGASAVIPNLDKPVVAVAAQLRAPLAEMLKTLKTSPLDALTDHALTRASGSGDAELTLKLSLPVTKPEKAGIDGRIALAGNDLRITPDSPLLERATGTVSFSENGFKIDGANARLYGGAVRIDGGSGASGAGASSDPLLAEFRAQGMIGAAGLRAASELGALAQLASHLSGETHYDATLRLRRGGAHLIVESDLQGLASRLPAPFSKPADAALALHFESAPLAAGGGNAKPQDRLQFTLGQIASASYVRDVSVEPARALRGSLTLGLGASAAPLPAAGVAARFDLARLDVAAWQALAAQPDERGAAPAAGKAGAAAWRSYLPTQWQGKVAQLDLEGYRLDQLALQGSRDSTLWRSEVDAQQLNGQIEFREGADQDPGHVRARLKRLVLAASKTPPAQQQQQQQQPAAQLPALDIVVDQFELRGLKLGRLEIDAVNRAAGAASAKAREWQLDRFELTTPDAHFSGSGRWASAGVDTAAAAARTAIDFRLDIADAGALLARFGMPGVLRRGRGALQGGLNWAGSPLSFDVPSLGGQFHLDIASGQFLKADPGLAKLLGVLSLQALPRRLSLDFRDLFSAGFAFDFVRGDVQIEQGIALTNNLQMKGANAAVLMEGSADIAHETQDLKVVVVPEVDAGTAALIAGVINPAIGLGTFLAQYFLSKPLAQAATQQFRIEGSWSDPRISKIARTRDAAALSATPGAVQ